MESVAACDLIVDFEPLLVAVTALWLGSRDGNGPLWRRLPTLSMPSNYLRAAAATPLLYGRCVLVVRILPDQSAQLIASQRLVLQQCIRHLAAVRDAAIG